MKIQQSWENKDLSLEAATKIVESFFALKNFVTKRREKNQQYFVLSSGPNKEGSYVRIDARIFREDNKIFVELSAGESPFVKMSAFTTLIFGGRPTIQGIKSEEMLNRMESEFFTYVGERILSAGNPTP